MHTPPAAFSWQLWRRHNKQLVIAGILLFLFAVIYPRICASFGFNPKSPDALEEMGNKLAANIGGNSARQIFSDLMIMFLAFGPIGSMMMSLLYVMWMFNFTEVNHKIKDPMAFPTRLFNLPVLTSFLFGWLLLGGMASVSLVYLGWIFLVPLPHFDIYATYQNWFAWMTALALTQGVIWSLAAWPLTRGLVLFGIFFGLITSPAWQTHFDSRFVLTPLFVLGVLLGSAGLRKMRYGQWQGWSWGGRLATLASRGKLRVPARFASPAQAQLWFEWRQFARGLCLFVAILTLVPVAGSLLWHGLVKTGPMEIYTLIGFTFFLLAAPAITHSAFGMTLVRKDMPFLLVRPITEGQMVCTIWKASAISTILSWVIVLAALSAMPLLGDFHAVLQSQYDLPFSKTACVFGLVFLTWRFAVVDLCFVLTGDRKLGMVPLWIVFVGAIAIVTLLVLQKNAAYWDAFVRLVPRLLAGLVIVKFLLAAASFRLSLKRRLMAPSTMLAYLGFWLLLVAALLVLFHPGKREFITPVSLWIILLVPLSRIGFSPMRWPGSGTLSQNEKRSTAAGLWLQ